MAEPILHLLGLAKKAGRLEIGEEPVGAAARARQARLLLVASDAADNTCRRVTHFSESGKIPWLTLPYTKSELGFQLGRGMVAIIALTDAGFAAAITDKLQALNPEIYSTTALELRTKADKMLMRQREKRQHEKNLLRAKQSPWAANSKDKSKAKAKKTPNKPKENYGYKSSTSVNENKPAGYQGGVKSTFPPASARPKRLTVRSKPVNTTLRKSEVAAHDE